MLSLPACHLDAIHRHAQDTYPAECCGILLGHRGENSWEVSEVHRAGNLAASGVHDRYLDRYLMDPKDRYEAERRARELKCEVIGFYHSHPDHDVYFSEMDIRNSEEFLMGEPWLPPVYAYFVVSIRDRVPQGHGAFLIDAGKAVSLTVRPME
jgi:proteasome lid subunit RPN8/RPN11